MLLVTFLLLAQTGQAADGSVRASLDRGHVQLGDTVTLTVKVVGSADGGTPDFSALSSDFKVLGTSQSSSFSIVNGHSTSSTSWAVQLRPRRVGRLTIPSIKVAGHTTDPLMLVVSAAAATARGGPGDPVFLSMTADIRNPYVGQQVTLTVRLFYAVSLNSGSIDTPQAQGLDVRKLGNNARYQSDRGGRHYEVVEEHYALIPQQVGNIVLPPVTFEGTQELGSGFGGFGGMFNAGQPVQAQSASLKFQVRARPKGEAAATWLPARQVALSLTGLPADGRVQIGEPLTLTLTEQATGLPFESLPAPTLPKLSGADVYPDQPQGKTSDDGNWLHGVRTRAFAVIPQQAGPLKIPEITLHWWNVNTDKADDASIPARTLTVTTSGGTAQPTSASNKTLNPPPAASASTGATKSASQVIVANPDGGSGRWRAVALLALGLWGLTMISLGLWVWWRRRRRRVLTPKTVPVAGRHLDSAFMQAVRRGDVGAQADALLAWARAERSEVHTLGELAATLQSSDQRAVIADLQRARYRSGAIAPEQERLIAAFAKGFDWYRSTRIKSTSLPPLYPE